MIPPLSRRNSAGRPGDDGESHVGKLDKAWTKRKQTVARFEHEGRLGDEFPPGK